ncbi:RNA-directed DNA polymerase, eukaryota, reverse transcriptase zinc-binding domain protein [Tanacetum coccineum]
MLHLWCKVIRSIHGPSGGLFDNTTVKYKSGPWYYIKKLKEDLQRNGINLPLMFKRKVGNGQGTSFWNDIWLGGPTLSSSFPRLYRLDANPSCLVSERIPTASSPSSPIVNSVIGLSSPPGLIFHWAWRRDIRTGHELEELNNLINLLAQAHLSEQPGSWECTLNNSRSFTVQGMRSHITSLSNLPVGHPTRWNKGLPIKININTWRVSNGRLPTRSNLDLRGIDLHLVRCPMCDNDIETEEHVFVSCPIAVNTWKQVLKWWRVNYVSMQNLLEVINLADHAPIEGKHLHFFDLVVQTTIWSIWRYRNNTVFSLKRPSKDLLLNEIKLTSFNWILSRFKQSSLNWIEWCNYPCNALSPHM